MQNAHYSAGRWYSFWHRAIGALAITFTALAGTGLVYRMQTSQSEWVVFVAGLIGVLAAILTSLQSFLDYANLAEKHRIAGARFAHQKHQIELLLFDPPSDEAKLVKTLEGIEKKWSILRTESAAIPSLVWMWVKRTDTYPQCEKDYAHIFPWLKPAGTDNISGGTTDPAK